MAVAVVQLVPPGAPPPDSAPAAGRFLLVQRPSSGLLAGLWQFPLLPLAGEGPAGAEEQRQLMDEHLEAMLGVQLLKQGQEQDACVGAGGGTLGGQLPLLLTSVLPCTGSLLVHPLLVAPVQSSPPCRHHIALLLPRLLQAAGRWWWSGGRWGRWCTSFPTSE